MTSLTTAEIASQPECWRRAAALAPSLAGSLPQAGERVAVVGCGTSWFMAMAYAGLREQAGQGETDAFAASEFPAGRTYDRVVAITRSGTTTEVVDLMRKLRDVPTVALTAVPGSPVTEVADESVLMDFADEESVVQTRFATTALALLRAHTAGAGDDVAAAAADAERALGTSLRERFTAAHNVSSHEPPPNQTTTADLDIDQVTFLGRGWTVGLAHEAALKVREAAQFWAEAYPAMDYRHGPIAVAQPGRWVWMFGEPPAGLAAEVAATGAGFVVHDLDPMAQLVLAQRLAVALAYRRGLDADRPRHLSRAVVLAEAGK